MVDHLSADELADRYDARDRFTLIDTRPSDSFEAWHLPNAVNVPYDPREGATDDQLKRVHEARNGEGPVYTICAKGLTSTPFAFEVEQSGIDDVSAVTGGMEAWSTVYEVVRIDDPEEDLVCRQLQRRGKGCLGYLVGSEAAGEAVVVDATRQTDRFAVAAVEADLGIGAAIDTHVHADHVSGSPEIAEALDVPYFLGATAAEHGVERAFDPIADGDVLAIGDVELEALHAPGHTTEMMNYRVDDRYLLTADTLFVDGVGRTELEFGEDDAARGAAMLHETLHDVILAQSDDLQILPGHVTVTPDGHFEGGTPGEPIAARLGDLREDLELLQLDQDAFVERLTSRDTEKPANYERIVGINSGREEVGDDEATELEAGPNNCAA